MWKDSETNIDLLDFDYLTKTINELIINENLTPSSIGIYGDWGCGKSSLMNMVESSFKEDKTILCINFNGWLFEGYEDAKSALLGTILDKISEKKQLSKKAKGYLKSLLSKTNLIKIAGKTAKYGLDFLLTGGIGTIASLTLDEFKKKLGSTLPDNITKDDITSTLNEIFSSDRIRKDIKTFQSDFEGLLEETKLKRVVVLIDELDRCTPDTILDTLEALRLFLFSKGMAFIIGADERQIQYAVKTKYPDIKGNQIDISKEYLEKLIQYPIRIPQLNSNQVQQYITCLLLENELSKEENNEIKSIVQNGEKDNFFDFELSFEIIAKTYSNLAEKAKDVLTLSKQISSVLAKGLNGNPRHCKRFLNALSLRMSMAKFKNKTLDRKILAKIMLIEYFKDGFYRALASQLNKEGISAELKMIEDEKWDDIQQLQIWKDDQWIKDWCNLEPKLGDVDLRLYFYFSRESLKNSNITSLNLSPKAENILENLLSKSDALSTTALKELSTISDVEVVKIHKSVFSKLETSSDLDSDLFNIFIEISKSNEILFADTLSMIASIPIDRIKISIIPYFGSFIKIIPDNSEGIRIMTNWGNDKKLSSAISNEMNKLNNK